MSPSLDLTDQLEKILSLVAVSVRCRLSSTWTELIFPHLRVGKPEATGSHCSNSKALTLVSLRRVWLGFSLVRIKDLNGFKGKLVP